MVQISYSPQIENPRSTLYLILFAGFWVTLAFAHYRKWHIQYQLCAQFISTWDKKGSLNAATKYFEIESPKDRKPTWNPFKSTELTIYWLISGLNLLPIILFTNFAFTGTGDSFYAYWVLSIIWLAMTAGCAQCGNLSKEWKPWDCWIIKDIARSKVTTSSKTS